jgi:CTP:molybdopterin cytidylyltransferase MocA
MAAARRSSRTRPGLSPRTDEFVCGLVLAAGGSSRLGRPKQLLAYRGGTLLGHVALVTVDPRCDVLVLLLGDQPGVTPATVDTLLAGRDGEAVLRS